MKRHTIHTILVNKDKHRISKSTLMKSLVVVCSASDYIDLGVSDSLYNQF